MNFLDQITPVILTWNEEVNIERCLQKLKWAKCIVVVDAFSNDKTLAILEKHPQVKIFQRKFDSHSQQWNFGLEKVSTDWVLSLDADYVLSDELVDEIMALSLEKDGYLIPFSYCIHGRPLRGTLLPPRLALFRKSKSFYIQDGHTQLLKLNGDTGCLCSVVYHDDRKPFSRWWDVQKKYVKLEADKLRQTKWSRLALQDRFRCLIFFAPATVFIYCLFFRGLILDGWIGLIYSCQRFLAEMLLSIALIRRGFK